VSTTWRTSSDDADLMSLFLKVNNPTAGPVLALSDRLQMSNAQASRRLLPADHEVLLRQAARLCHGPVTVDHCLALAHGELVDVRCHVPGPDVESGAVFEILDKPTGDTPTVPGAARFRSGITGTGVTGTSDSAQRLQQQLEALTADRDDVLVMGEPGTGKAYCATILLRGSTTPFSDIDIRQSGLSWRAAIDAAIGQGHSLLIRHIDEVPTPSERSLVSLLRQARAADLRVVFTCATVPSNPDVALLFRKRLRLAPLRERREDIPALVSALYLAHVHTAQRPHLSQEALRSLWAYAWPGNIAELNQVIREAARCGTGRYIEQSSLRMPRVPAVRGDAHLTVMQASERETILDALRRCRGNKHNAAAMLGIARSTLYLKLRALGLNAEAISQVASSATDRRDFST
jgi:hypothetical protein